MVYDVEDLIIEIKTALDMNNSSDQLISINDIDTLTLDELIRSKIAVSARIVETNAPRYLLDSGRAFGGTIGWLDSVGMGTGIIHLPDDFMRLVTFQMSDWSYPVTEAITEESPEYLQQSNQFICGNPQRPVVAITQQPIGQVLEFYSCTEGSGVTLRRARYIPYPKISNGGIEICEKLKDAVIHYAAYMTALSTGHMEQSEALLNMSKELMK